MYLISAKSISGNLFDKIFLVILVSVMLSLFGTAYYLQRYKKVVKDDSRRNDLVIRTQFIVEQKKNVKEVYKKIEPVKETIVKKTEKEVVDLSDKPVMAQKEDVSQEQKPAEVKPVRKVYGLKKVYSKGLGAGGNLSDAVIGKLGNTINAEVDTFVATEKELKGVLASTTTITQAPRFKKTVKPEYTKEMIDNKIEGVVKLKVLIDIDGKVKKATVISDLGLNSAKQALEATKEMEFIPAMRGNEAVAVWIVIPIRFIIIS